MNHAEIANILENVYGRKKGEDIPIVQASLKAAADERKIASGEYAPKNKCANCGIDLGPIYCPKCYKAVHGEPENEPLTLDQLRQMDRKPVWCDWVGGWAIVYIDGTSELTFVYWDGSSNTLSELQSCNINLLAYARKPEQEDDHA